MSSTTVRLSEETRVILRELSRQSGASMGLVIERAVECYRRQQLLEAANAGFAALRADPEAWAAEEAERRAWDATVSDDLAPSREHR